MRFKVFGYIVEITQPKIWMQKQYKPGIYTFTNKGKWYWDFARSFDADISASTTVWGQLNHRECQLFGPFDDQSSACADWLKGCKTHEYKIPWPVIHRGEISDNTPKWRSIRGSWDNSDGFLRTHG